MKVRKLLRILHRDFGYFITAMTLVYAISGIYLNHRHDFNPDYKIFFTDFTIDKPQDGNWSAKYIEKNIEALNDDIVFKKHYTNDQGLIKVFIENGEVVINPSSGEGTMQYLQKRPFIFGMNRLHRSTLGTLWKWVSDIMASVLIFVALSGLFLLKGKRGLLRWGWWLVIAGIVVPLFFVIVYI